MLSTFKNIFIFDDVLDTDFINVQLPQNMDVNICIICRFQDNDTDIYSEIFYIKDDFSVFNGFIIISEVKIDLRRIKKVL